MTKFSNNAQTVLCNRYLHKSEDAPKCIFCGENHETSEDMLRRCSLGREDFYDLLSSLDFLPNSPTLFNTGLDTSGTASGCFKFDVEDSMEGILEVARKSGMVQKFGGGVGYCLSDLRPRGAHIKSTHGRACGPVEVLKFYHSVATLITQGGKREGAQMGVLSCYHPDIEEFIRCKIEDPQALSTFNVSVACTDKFMERALEEGTSEASILDQIVEGAYSVGDPGIFFIDTAERANPTPHLGKLTGTNPCGEVPLLDNEPCNLGSINLSHFVVNKKVDWDRLESIVPLCVEYLDEILSQNTFPDDRITEAALRTRKIGLGIMGWADMLVLLDLHYDSTEAVELGHAIMQTIQREAHEKSKRLGQELGTYSGSDGDPKRNAALTCIAPAGSISILADCSSGIEPHISLEYIQYLGDRTPLKYKLEILETTDFVPKTALGIGWEWHVKHQEAFQASTDLAVSKTINLPSDTPIETIRSIFRRAWESKCKGITVYRDGSRQIQAIDIVPAEIPDGDYDAKVHKFRLGDMKGFLHWGLKNQGDPFELFITASKQGSTIDGLLDAVAILTSIALQAGVPLDDIARKMRGRRFEPSGLTNNPNIPTASSVLDYISRYATLKFLGKLTSYNSGMECPDCGASVTNQEGCLTCSENCGWSRC